MYAQNASLSEYSAVSISVQFITLQKYSEIIDSQKLLIWV